ncbi:hypothetical protein BGZ46_005951, partial [Entomortierella lignicola]
MCPFKPAASWQTICTPRQLGGLGVIDLAVQAIAFQWKHLRNMLGPEPSIGHSVLMALLSHYSQARHTLTPVLMPTSSMAKKASSKVRSIKVLLQAAVILPQISLSWLGNPLPPSETFFATPMRWWVYGLDGNFLPSMLPFTIGDILQLNPVSHLLELHPDLEQNALFQSILTLWPFLFCRSIIRAMTEPILSIGEDLSQRLLLVPLPDPTRPLSTPPTLGTATSKDLRSFIQKPPENDRRYGTPAEWKSFWKAHIPHRARTIWWRALHGKLATAQLRVGTWHLDESTSCRICNHPTEDIPHMLFLCPTKKHAWIALLQEFTSKQQWSDE